MNWEFRQAYQLPTAVLFTGILLTTLSLAGCTDIAESDPAESNPAENDLAPDEPATTGESVEALSESWLLAEELTLPYPVAIDGVKDTGLRFVELNADGRTDLVYHWVNGNKVHKGAYINTPAGWEWAPEFTPPYPTAIKGVNDTGVELVELNGDGRVDMVFHRWINANKQHKGAYINTPNGWESADEFTPPYPIAATNVQDMSVRFIRLNADNRMDVVFHRKTGNGKIHKGAYINTPNGWEETTKLVPPVPIAVDGTRDRGVRFFRLNADGREDMVHHYWVDKNVQAKGAYINTPNGWESADEFTPPYPIAAKNVHDMSVRFIRLNADNRMDMVFHRRTGNGKTHKGAFIVTAVGWQERPEFEPPYPIADDDVPNMGARFVSLNGDNRTDMVYHRRVKANVHAKGAYINTPAGWEWTPELAPPVPLATDGLSNTGARLVELDADGRVDLVRFRRIEKNKEQKGAYLNVP